MKKEMFITKAVRDGATYQEAFWLESVYSKMAKDLTAKEKEQVNSFFEEKPNEDLFGLCLLYKQKCRPTLDAIVESAIAELKQFEKDCEFAANRMQAQFKIKLIARLTDLIQEDLYPDIPDIPEF